MVSRQNGYLTTEYYNEILINCSVFQQSFNRLLAFQVGDHEHTYRL